jgi:hypothetical protein
MATRSMSISPSVDSAERTPSPNGPRDQHDLGAVQLTLNDLAQLLGIAADDPDAGHLGACVTPGRGQRERIDVVHLAIAWCTGDVDELTADAHHRQSRPRMHEHPLTTDGRKQADLRCTDDHARAHRHIAGLHIVTGAPHVGARGHTAQHPNLRVAAVGPPQGQHRVGECRHRRPGLDASGLPRLQPARRPRASLDVPDNRQPYFDAVAVPVVGITALTNLGDVDAAHRVTVDRGLVERGQRPLGHHLFGAHQALGFGNRDADRSGRDRRRHHARLLLLHRTHSMPFCSSTDER